MDNPLVWFWLLMGGSALAFFLNFKRWFKALLAFALGWLVLMSATPFPQWLARKLESRYPPFTLEKNALDSTNLNILILGGGHVVSPQLPAINQLSMEAVGRLTEGIRVHQMLPGSKLVCSGYSASNRSTQAEMLAAGAIELGVKPIDTLLSITPSNTWEELVVYRSRFGIRPFILVTSAIHMPRAMAVCNELGLKALPAPTNHLLKIDPQVSPYDFTPSYHKIMLMQRVLHEYLGMILFNFKT